MASELLESSGSSEEMEECVFSTVEPDEYLQFDIHQAEQRALEEGFQPAEFIELSGSSCAICLQEMAKDSFSILSACHRIASVSF
jgi:hypothetical protein